MQNFTHSSSNHSFFDRPAFMLAVFIAAVSFLWTLQCSLFQYVLGKDIIEVIVWGAQGQWGHYKHPPLSGWVGFAFSWISGHSDWSMYFAAQATLAFGAFFVYKLAREFLPETGAATAALLLYTLHYYNPSPMKFCSHFMESALQPMMAYYFYLALKDDRMRHWFLFGFASALGLLAKYSAGMLLTACFLYMLIDRDARKRFASVGPYFAAMTALLFLLPHIAWLTRHNFSCLRHLENRIDDPEPWYFVFLVLLTALMPFLIEAAYLFVAQMPWRKKNIPQPLQKKPLLFALTLTLLPSLYFVAIAALDKHVILMWFSSLASWTGLAVVAAFPWLITKSTFKRLYFLVLIYTGIIFIGTTVDIVIKPRLRCHLKPAEFVAEAQNFMSRHAGTAEIPAVIGERWICGVIENYSPNRPPACDQTEPFSLDLIRDIVYAKGALLLASDPDEFRNLLGENFPLVKFEPFHYEYTSPSGKKKDADYCFGWLPPGMLPKTISPDMP